MYWGSVELGTCSRGSSCPPRFGRDWPYSLWATGARLARVAAAGGDGRREQGRSAGGGDAAAAVLWAEDERRRLC